MTAEPTSPRRRGRVPASAGSVGLAAIVVVVTLFAVLNLNSVKVNFIVGSGHAPLIVVIAVSLLLGAGAATLGQRLAARRRGRGS